MSSLEALCDKVARGSSLTADEERAVIEAAAAAGMQVEPGTEARFCLALLRRTRPILERLPCGVLRDHVASELDPVEYLVFAEAGTQRIRRCLDSGRYERGAPGGRLDSMLRDEMRQDPRGTLFRMIQLGDNDRLVDRALQFVPPNFNAFSSFIDAVQWGRLKTVKRLMQEVGDANAGLRNASIAGELEVMRYMLEQGADNLNASLWGAIQNDELEAVKLLVERGADPLAENAQGMNALEWAEDLQADDDIIDYLS